MILEGDGNELNIIEFKRFDTSTIVIMTQQIKNIRDNATLMMEIVKVTGDTDLIVNVIDYVRSTLMS